VRRTRFQTVRLEGGGVFRQGLICVSRSIILVGASLISRRVPRSRAAAGRSAIWIARPIRCFFGRTRRNQFVAGVWEFALGRVRRLLRDPPPAPLCVACFCHDARSLEVLRSFGKNGDRRRVVPSQSPFFPNALKERGQDL